MDVAVWLVVASAVRVTVGVAVEVAVLEAVCSESGEEGVAPACVEEWASDDTGTQRATRWGWEGHTAALSGQLACEGVTGGVPVGVFEAP